MPALSKADIKSILRNELGNQEYEFLACEDRSISDVSMGFLSSSGKVTIVYRYKGIIEELHVFVKRLPSEEIRKNEVILMGSFVKEPLVYNLFLNKIDGRGKRFFPRCFLARSNDIVVLEDLTSNGYINLPSLCNNDLEHCRKTLDSIARLHSASFAFEIKNNCKLDEFIPDLDKEHIFSPEIDHVGRKRYISGIYALQKVAEVYLPEYSSQVVKKAFDFMRLVPNKLDKSLTFPNVLVHSDLWNNNIMFKYDDQGRVSNVCLLDFQCSAYRPPTFDVQIYIHCCTSSSLRAKYGKALLEYYYSQLQQYLMEEDIDVKSILGWNIFELMCQETLPVALVMTVQFMHFVCMPEEVVKPILTDERQWKEYYQVNRDNIVLQAAEKYDVYRNKIIEGLRDLFEYFTHNQPR